MHYMAAQAARSTWAYDTNKQIHTPNTHSRYYLPLKQGEFTMRRMAAQAAGTTWAYDFPLLFSKCVKQRWSKHIAAAAAAAKYNNNAAATGGVSAAPVDVFTAVELVVDTASKPPRLVETTRRAGL
jgi:hypothetical protein